jgi:hypothetical protein
LEKLCAATGRDLAQVREDIARSERERQLLFRAAGLALDAPHGEAPAVQVKVEVAGLSRPEVEAVVREVLAAELADALRVVLAEGRAQ